MRDKQNKQTIRFSALQLVYPAITLVTLRNMMIVTTETPSLVMGLMKKHEWFKNVCLTRLALSPSLFLPCKSPNIETNMQSRKDKPLGRVEPLLENQNSLVMVMADFRHYRQTLVGNVENQALFTLSICTLRHWIQLATPNSAYKRQLSVVLLKSTISMQKYLLTPVRKEFQFKIRLIFK